MSPPRLSASLARLIFLALVISQTPAVAQTPPSFDGLEIVRLDLDVPPGTDAKRARDAIHFREGDLYRDEAARAAVAAIYGLGEFASVSVEPAFAAGGVRVVFHLKARPRVHAVRFEGDLGLAETALLDLLQAKTGAVASPYTLKADREAIRSHYTDEGYLFADVRQETQAAEDGTDIVYHIEAGPKLTVELIRFEGNAHVPDDDIEKVMMGVKSGSIFETGKYDPSLLRSDLLAARELFRRRGYLDATVGHEVLFDASKERAYLVVRITEGPLYTIERLRLEGARVLKPDELLDLMKSREGAAYSQEQLDKDYEAVRSRYGRIGYIKAEVHEARTFSDKETKVSLTLTVTEGDKYYVHKVYIRGNLHTQDHVIRRNVIVLPGEVANTDELAETKRRLENTGYFSSREQAGGGETVKANFVESGPGQADVVVEVVEGSVGNFSIGAGISSSQGVVGSVQLTHNNFDATGFPESWRQFLRGDIFTGNGEVLTIALMPGTVIQDYRLSWMNPSVWDSPYSVGFDVYLHDLGWSDFYDEQRAGGRVTVGRRFLRDLVVNVSPGWEVVSIRNLDATAPEDAVLAKGRHERRAMTVSASYDRRDNVFLTTSGYRLGAAVEMAGTAFGGDVNTVRESAEARTWWTLWNSQGLGEYFLRGKQILTVGGELGLIESTESAPVPIFDRFYIGGLGTLRGFAWRRVGPVDDVFQKQIGGVSKLLLNAEYEIPIIRDYVRLVGFVDSGSLSMSLSDLGQFRVAVGGGLRIRIPFMMFERIPISFYVASPVLDKPGDKSEMISFQIGTSFAF